MSMSELGSGLRGSAGEGLTGDPTGDLLNLLNGRGAGGGACTASANNRRTSAETGTCSARARCLSARVNDSGTRTMVVPPQPLGHAHSVTHLHTDMLVRLDETRRECIQTVNRRTVLGD